MIRELTCRGPAVGLATHFESLCFALRSPSCTLQHIQLSECDWPEGRRIEELLAALEHRGAFLKHLGIYNMPSLQGELTASFFEKCDRLELVEICSLPGLSGPVPASVNNLVECRVMMLWGNKLRGSPDKSKLIRLEKHSW